MIDVSKSTPAGCVNIAHWQPWHGDSSHVPLLYPLNGTLIPYDETNPAILADQVTKMKLDGIGAINVDYYVNQPFLEKATGMMLTACLNGGLGFSICVDAGGEGQHPVAPLTTTEEYIAALSFVAGEYMRSLNYLRDGQGRAIVNFFDEQPNIDWAAVRAAIPVQMAFLFEGTQFTHPQADGGFGWPNPIIGDPTNINAAAIQAFNDAAAANPTKIAWYPAYAGFDDSLAGWGKKRVIARGSGRTLRMTLGMVPKTAKYMLIPWNDHEEGSGIEEGVYVAT